MSFVKINQFGIFWFSHNNSDCYTVGQGGGRTLYSLLLSTEQHPDDLPGKVMLFSREVIVL